MSLFGYEPNKRSSIVRLDSINLLLLICSFTFAICNIFTDDTVFYHIIVSI